MENKLISLNFMDILTGDSVMTNVNISITPVIDGIEQPEARKSILGSTMQNDNDINVFVAELQTALDKLILAKGV